MRTKQGLLALLTCSAVGWFFSPSSAESSSGLKRGGVGAAALPNASTASLIRQPERHTNETFGIPNKTTTDPRNAHRFAKVQGRPLPDDHWIHGTVLARI